LGVIIFNTTTLTVERAITLLNQFARGEVQYPL
jgi:hypothetical protein